jgi:hypothetical protein
MGVTGVTFGTLVGAFVGIALHFWNSMAKTRSVQFSKEQLMVEGIMSSAVWALPVGALVAVAFPLVASEALKILFLCAGAALLAVLFWKAVLLPEDGAALRELGNRLVPSALRPNTSEV